MITIDGNFNFTKEDLETLVKIRFYLDNSQKLAVYSDDPFSDEVVAKLKLYEKTILSLCENLTKQIDCKLTRLESLQCIFS